MIYSYVTVVVQTWAYFSIITIMWWCRQLRKLPGSISDSMRGCSVCIYQQCKAASSSSHILSKKNLIRKLVSVRRNCPVIYGYLQNCQLHGLYSSDKRDGRTRRTSLAQCSNKYCSSFTDPDQTPPWRMLFMGSDDFSLVHLKALHQNMNAEVGTVVKSLEVVAPKHRKNPVNRYCKEHDLTTHSWPLETMSDRFDVGVVSSFGHLIPDRIISMFPYGIINVHASFLPKYRGGAPLIHAILNADRESGVSIMDIKPKRFDIGPVLLQTKCLVPPHCTTLQLQDVLASEGTKLLIRVLEDMPRMKSQAEPQSAVEATLAPRPDADICFANWEEDYADEIERQFKAVHEKFYFRTTYRSIKVTLYNLVSQEIMKEEGILHDIAETFANQEVKAGHPYYHRKTETLCIKCKDGWVAFKDINIKKLMTARNFYHGYLAKEKNRGLVFESRANKLEKYMLSKQRR